MVPWGGADQGYVFPRTLRLASRGSHGSSGQHLTRVVDDRNELDDTFEQWERSALAALYKPESQGHPVRKVMVDVETYLTWCRGRGRSVNGASRAEYVTALLRIADGSA